MDIPYTVEARRDTGLINGKIGIWLFLASEVMLFGALFASYILIRVGAPSWPRGESAVTGYGSSFHSSADWAAAPPPSPSASAGWRKPGPILRMRCWVRACASARSW